MACLRIRFYQAPVNAGGLNQFALGLRQLAGSVSRLRRMIRTRIAFHQALVSFDRLFALSGLFLRLRPAEKLVRCAADFFFAGRVIFDLFAWAKNDGRRTPLWESHAGGQERKRKRTRERIGIRSVMNDAPSVKLGDPRRARQNRSENARREARFRYL